MAVTEGKPWEKQPEENPKWYGRFLYYLELGTERTLEQAYKNWWDTTNIELQRVRSRPKRPPSTWYEKCRKDDWKARALKWDEEQQRAVLREAAQAQKEMSDRHVQIAMRMISAGVQRLQKLYEDGSLATMSAAETLRYIEAGIKVERQARGFPTETLEYYALTDEELIRKYSDLYRRLEAAGSAGSGNADEGVDPAGDDAVQPGDETV